MHLIDTHAHAHFKSYDDKEGVVKRALAEGIDVINIGTGIETSKEVIELAEKFEKYVYATIGIHPTHTDEAVFHANEDYEASVETEFNEALYEPLVQNPKVVGIGECGLDYYRFPEGADESKIKEVQKKVFVSQINFAIKHNKALVIHCRPSKESNDAYDDMLEIVGKAKLENPALRFEVHSFTGDTDVADKIITLGGFLGLNGIITFDKTGRSERVVKHVPLEFIVLETDSPFLAPVPYRGKTNEPAFVKHVAEKIAEWKGVNLEEVATTTTHNAKDLFNI
jgi:TatD DNase family protein